ncbi:MAG: hypothetical protein HY254_11265 [Burkholderiales bacterium]|nr:hypothetical protein [Burkholderiales bacterium]
MSVLSAACNNTKPRQTGRHVHVEAARHSAVIVVSVVWLLVTAAFAWQASKQCGNSCFTDEYLLMFSPAAGVMLLAYGCRLMYLRKRLGDMVLQLPQPLHPGCRAVPATLYFIDGLGQGMRHPAAAYPLALEVVCTHVDNSGEGKSNQILWSQKFKDTRIAHGTGSADFTLNLPANLPGSGKLGRSDIKIIWKLQVRVLSAKVSFVLPVKVLVSS